MRHYEIVFLVHPSQSEQVSGMIERYTDSIKKDGGQVHRLENWGRRHLAYPINKIYKAHYVLMNVECNQALVDELTTNFRYNDAVLRHIVIRTDKPVTEESPIAKAERENRNNRDRGHPTRTPRTDSSGEEPSAERKEPSAQETEPSAEKEPSAETKQPSAPEEQSPQETDDNQPDVTSETNEQEDT